MEILTLIALTHSFKMLCSSVADCAVPWFKGGRQVGLTIGS